jgi:segregation and condensation protein B
MINKIEQNIEALIFASDKSISIAEIKNSIESTYHLEFTEQDILTVIQTIQEKYKTSSSVIELVKMDGGYQFLTKKEYHPIINQLQVHRSKKKLSQTAIETLAIIAYKQPITKLEIEQIRGVNCDYTVQKLLEKELIQIAGKADTVGKPIRYSTSSIFMDYFGVNSIAELPQLKEIISEHNEIGPVTE